MIECQTLELVKLNQKIADAHNEVINMSDRSVQALIHVVRSEIHPLFKISEGIAMIDMIASFAQLVTTHDYVRPELTDTLAIKAGRHPIREKIQTDKYIPNDVYATQQTRFQIITGCNMSGKSTYIRSIALMTVMAQIGCFVPAQYASFPISHQLFARISTDDNVEGNVSTFAAEMREIAFIVRNIERRSLVIIDELGRGTSTTDGLAIAIAIAEAFIESRAYVWFVTHFRDLARILAERAGVVNLHLAVDISVNSSKMKMLYKVADGYEEEKFYGLVLARVVDLPKDVITTATEVSKALHRDNEARKSNAKVLSVCRRRKLVLSLREQLILAKQGGMEGEELRQWLKRLQDEFAVRMQAIEAESALALVEREGTAESGQDSNSRPSADQEDQAAPFPTDHGESLSPAAEGKRSTNTGVKGYGEI
jgi:DNA mismatch repair protein MSH4